MDADTQAVYIKICIDFLICCNFYPSILQHMRRSLLLFLLACLTFSLFAQNSSRRRAATADASATDSALLSKVKYRLVGPFRGGQSAAVAGSYRNKNTFYFDVL